MSSPNNAALLDQLILLTQGNHCLQVALSSSEQNLRAANRTIHRISQSIPTTSLPIPVQLPSLSAFLNPVPYKVVVNSLQRDHCHHRCALEYLILRSEPGITTITYFGGRPWNPFHCSFEENDIQLITELYHFLEVTKHLPTNPTKHL